MAMAKSTRRPFGVTVLSCMVFLLAAVYLVRFAQTLLTWKYLETLLPFSPAYLALTGLFWFFTASLTGWGLWRGWFLIRRATPIFLIGFSAAYWGERLFLPSYSERNENWLFVVALNFIGLVWALFVLSRPQAIKFFEEKHEQPIQDTTSA
jgi:hypothetical protein